MKKSHFLVAAAVTLLVAALVSGSLVASNMGFKLNYPLQGAGAGSLDGTNSIALPFNAQSGITTAAALKSDIETSTGVSVVNIQQLLKADNSFQAYTGARGSVDFPLNAGEGYRVRMSADANYIVVGSHDPSLSVSLTGPGAGSLDGTNEYAYPYHSTATTASELRNEIGAGTVVNVQQLLKSDNSFQAYTGARGSVDFPLVPGEAYRIRVNADVSFAPAHY